MNAKDLKIQRTLKAKQERAARGGAEVSERNRFINTLNQQFSTTNISKRRWVFSPHRETPSYNFTGFITLSKESTGIGWSSGTLSLITDGGNTLISEAISSSTTDYSLSETVNEFNVSGVTLNIPGGISDDANLTIAITDDVGSTTTVYNNTLSSNMNTSGITTNGDVSEIKYSISAPDIVEISITVEVFDGGY